MAGRHSSIGQEEGSYGSSNVSCVTYSQTSGCECGRYTPHALSNRVRVRSTARGCLRFVGDDPSRSCYFFFEACCLCRRSLWGGAAHSGGLSRPCILAPMTSCWLSQWSCHVIKARPLGLHLVLPNISSFARCGIAAYRSLPCADSRMHHRLKDLSRFCFAMVLSISVQPGRMML